MRKNIKKKGKKRNKTTLNLFHKPGQGLYKKCPLSGKEAPIIDYKNIKVLKKFISENGKIIPSRVSSVSFKKQKLLSRAIKRARILALI
tara:strand:- start:1115 stop:1381 length:267 start_codon:yes stop_codon:yes gene_type:complete